MFIEELFQEGTKLPSLPEVFYRLKEAVDDPDFTFEEISEIVLKEPGLSARLLKIVNSAFYGFPQKVETISHAIGIIGIQELRDLVFSTTIMGSFKGIPKDAINMESYWKHNLACGVTGKLLARHLEILDYERVFVAGLLHDIGRLLICMRAPKQFLESVALAKSENKTLPEAEQEVFGFTHAEVGAVLLTYWKLPPFFEEVAKYHHDPIQAHSFPMETAIVHSANILTHKIVFADNSEIGIEEIDPKIKKVIGIEDDDFYSNLAEEASEQFEEASQVFLQNA